MFAGLKRRPSPANPSVRELWKRTIPLFPPVNTSWEGRTNEVWPLPATGRVAVPS